MIHNVPWKMAFTGTDRSVCGHDFKPDVIYQKSKSYNHGSPVPISTAVILELQSRSSGVYNAVYRLGKAAHYNVREHLCALLNSSPRDNFMELPVLSMSGVKYETIHYLDCGATKIVCVKDGSGRCDVAKIPLSTKSLQNDHDVLSKLQNVEGVPKMLGWFDDGKALKISPVGQS